MTGGDREVGPSHDEVRVPTALRERIDQLFVAYRGYEPVSFQESLSAIADLAEAAAEADAVTPDPESVDAADETADQRSDATGEFPGPFDPATPLAASKEDTAGDSPFEESVSFDEYVEGLDDPSVGPTAAVKSMLDTQNADGIVQELAAEVLDEMTDDAFEELEHGVDHGMGAGVTDGMGATDAAAGGTTAPSGSDGDGVPESLTADPESDCIRCGRSHAVSVLQTTILEEDGSVALVCPSCVD